MELREYQSSAVRALQNFLATEEGNPIVCAPTGSGKSVIIAKFIERSPPGKRILMLTHVKELIEQNYARLKKAWPAAPVGIFSAGVGRKDTRFPITYAGIQSIYKKASLFGHIDLVIIDECHLLGEKSEGMYQSFLTDLRAVNPKLRVVGFTATPWREKGGLLTNCTLFTEICYEISLRLLIDQGYLSPLVSKSSVVQADLKGIKTVAGDFDKKQLAAEMDRDDLTSAAIDEVLAYANGRKKWLVFCSSVDHAMNVSVELGRRGIVSDFVSGETPRDEREAILESYTHGNLQALCNYGVLTTGFDAPDTDLIALLRPTKSAGLYVQMLGRGMRLATLKKDCLVLDFGGNIERFGPVDRIQINTRAKKGEKSVSVQPTKICPECRGDCHAAAKECPTCAYQFIDERELKIESTASDLAVMGNARAKLKVDTVEYRIHEKSGKPDSLCVTYHCGLASHSEYVCFEHEGFAKRYARKWWQLMAYEGYFPGNTALALKYADKNMLRSPSHIFIEKDGKYFKVVDYLFSE